MHNMFVLTISRQDKEQIGIQSLPFLVSAYVLTVFWDRESGNWRPCRLHFPVTIHGRKKLDRTNRSNKQTNAKVEKKTTQ